MKKLFAFITGLLAAVFLPLIVMYVEEYRHPYYGKKGRRS
jgi:hypothetical protein